MSENKDTKSTGNTTSNTRRKALKAIGVSGVLAGTIPGSWSTPVVKSVMLPAHAQTSQPTSCGNPGPCQPGMSTNILTAVRPQDGSLFILGEAQIPPGSACFTGFPDPSMSSTITCAVIDDGVVIQSDSGGAGGDCYPGSISQSLLGCLVSCSVNVDAGDNTLAIGDCVTLRVTFRGACVCSATATVT